MPPKMLAASSAPPWRAAQPRMRDRKGSGRTGRVGGVRAPFYIASVRTPNPVLSLPILLALMVLTAVPASAACASLAAPRVDWRRCLMDGRDFSGADLTGAVLRDASMSRAQLTEAKLAGADADSLRLGFADLSGADLTGARLRNADLTRATLRGATLRNADLRRARLFAADLSGADLTGALLEGADLLNATLDGARWTDGQRVCAAGSTGSCL